MMQAPIGIWIDHRRALVFDLRDPSGCCMMTVESHASEARGTGKAMRHVPPHRFGGSTEHHVKHGHDGAIASFYREVIDAVRDQPAMVVVGPGKAHSELVAALGEIKGQHPEVVAELGLDAHLSEAQIAARLRELAREHPAA